MASTTATLSASYAAASQVTSQNVTGVAATYEAWIASKGDAELAAAALAGAARSSKSPEAVLVRAAALYLEIPAVLDADDVPVFTSISPSSGAAAGGTATVITGTDLTGVTSVTFGGVAGTAFSVTNDEHIAVTTPAHAAGAVTVALVGGLGGTVSAAAAFTYT